MKSLIAQNKSVIRFIGVFLLSYTVLYGLYIIFLRYSGSPDPYTLLVSEQSMALLNGFGFDTTAQIDHDKGLVNLFTRGRNVVFVMEGCNAASVIILFLSFVLAFSKGWRKTSLFILAGVVVIYSFNLIRIALLTISLYYHPNLVDLLHGVLFPAVIYGIVMLLWIVWIRSFNTKSTHATETH